MNKNKWLTLIVLLGGVFAVGVAATEIGTGGKHPDWTWFILEWAGGLLAGIGWGLKK